MFNLIGVVLVLFAQRLVLRQGLVVGLLNRHLASKERLILLLQSLSIRPQLLKLQVSLHENQPKVLGLLLLQLHLAPKRLCGRCQLCLVNKQLKPVLLGLFQPNLQCEHKVGLSQVECTFSPSREMSMLAISCFFLLIMARSA